MRRKSHFCGNYFHWKKWIQGEAVIKSSFSAFSGIGDRQTELHDKALWWLIPFVAINADSSPPPHRHTFGFIRYCSDVYYSWIFQGGKKKQHTHTHKKTQQGNKNLTQSLPNYFPTFIFHLLHCVSSFNAPICNTNSIKYMKELTTLRNPTENQTRFKSHSRIGRTKDFVPLVNSLLYAK